MLLAGMRAGAATVGAGGAALKNEEQGSHLCHLWAFI